MTFAFARRAATCLLAAFLLAGTARAGERDAEAQTFSYNDVRRKLEEHQVRILELERMLKDQERLLRALQQQLAEQRTHSASEPRSASASEPLERGVTAQEEMNRTSGEVNALAQSLVPVRSDVQKPAETQHGQEKASPLTAGWTGSHPYIRNADGTFYMQFGGRMQFDWRSHTGEVTPPGMFLIRRARLEAEGQLFKHYEYKVQADFAEVGTTLLRDGFLNINYIKPFQVKFGQFKAPFSQEQSQSSKYMDFVERSSVNNLAPGRSQGLMIHGKVTDGVFQYYLGAFNGRGELLRATNATPETFLRLRFTPFKKGGVTILKNFSFGGAVSQGRNEGVGSFRGRTASRSITFFDRVAVNGKVQRSNGEFWWNHRNFSLRGEYVQTNQFREGLDAGSGNLPGVVGKGYLLQASYLLTGEGKRRRGISPRSAFLGDKGGLGAWELAFRYENLQMHDAFNPNRHEAYTFGLNWWLTKFVRYQSNFVLERFRDPGRAPTSGKRDHFSFLSRMQVIF